MIELQNRIYIWKALSGFYLDTELQDEDYSSIFKILLDSGKSLTDLKEIDLYEVFPTLQGNLKCAAGVWEGFDEKWLEMECMKNYRRKNKGLFRLMIRIRNTGTSWMRKKHWERIEDKFRNQVSFEK